MPPFQCDVGDAKWPENSGNPRVIIDIIANRTVTPTNLVIFYDDVPNPSAANIGLTSNDLTCIHAPQPSMHRKTTTKSPLKMDGEGPPRPHTKPTVIQNG
jgi:hypothetical protein